VRRSPEAESQIIRRVFHDATAQGRQLGDYLDSFLPLSREKLRPLAQNFYTGLRQGAPAGPLVSAVVTGCNKFEDKADFPRFLESLLEAASGSTPVSAEIPQRERLRRLVNEAAVANGSYNQSPPLILENFVYNYRNDK
jgi:hypothetical protein